MTPWLAIVKPLSLAGHPFNAPCSAYLVCQVCLLLYAQDNRKRPAVSSPILSIGALPPLQFSSAFPGCRFLKLFVR